MLRKTRTILATVFFVCITLLFLDFTGELHHWFGWMAKIQFLPALLALNVIVLILLIALTLIFGRIYCSVICPLGVFQDAIAWIHNKRKKNRYSYSKGHSLVRYIFLAIMVLAFFAGVNVIVELLAPYSAYGRMASAIMQPIYIFGNNILASMAEKADSYAFYHADLWFKSLPVLIVAVITFIILFVLAWRNGRTYCNTICPVGTVLSFISRFSWMKVYFDDSKCKNCSKCSKNCKASCIDYQSHTVDYSRCVVCGNCINNCKFGALKYGHPAAKSDNKQPTDTQGNNTDTSKRAFLLTSVALSTAALAQEGKKVDGGLAVIQDKVAPKRQTPITPPGSLSMANLSKRCTACQLCVTECPNGVLRPSSDLNHFMQPTVSYERGYCRPECTRCSEVCPTGAINLLTKADKSATQIGHAVWIEKNCIPLTDGWECGNCARHCPAGAIEMVPSDPDDESSPLVPAVNETRCIGCGACENLCPARPFSAIHVEGHEVHHHI